LIRCPGGIGHGRRCFVVPLQRLRSTRRRQWLLLQQRQLTCAPASGGYSNPDAACRALADYVAAVDRQRGSACGCTAQIWPPEAVGVFRGRRVELDLSACCLDARAGADRDVLLPGLGA